MTTRKVLRQSGDVALEERTRINDQGTLIYWAVTLPGGVHIELDHAEAVTRFADTAAAIPEFQRVANLGRAQS